MKRTFFLLFPLALLLSACDIFGPGAPPPIEPQPQPVLTLSASLREGDAPLRVTFTATLEPRTSASYRWRVGKDVQNETSSSFGTTFESPGVYVVSAEAEGASGSVSITVGGDPVTEPTPDTLSLSQTPGGAAPWAVRYTATPAAEGLEARCREKAAFRRVQGDSFACVHEPGDSVQARYVNATGEITASAEATPAIHQNEGVAFAGRWLYTSRGKTETFAIREGDETSGSSANGRFKLFTVGQRQGLVVEFTIDGQTVVLIPTPADDGTQRYRDEVYGLRLKPLPENDVSGPQ